MSKEIETRGNAAYDAIAGQYAAIVPFMMLRKCWDDNVQRVLGDISGKSILDLACGSGHYTRRLKQRGAAEVVGVDVSAEMLQFARADEERDPLGITYLHRDARDLGHVGDFDVVTASFLLDYAPDARALSQMLRAIRRNLKPDGRFVALAMDIVRPEDGVCFDVPGHGIAVRARPGPLVDGAEVLVTVTQDAHTVQLVNYYLSRTTRDRAFTAAGFADVTWRNDWVVSPDLGDAAALASLAALLRRLPIWLVECRV